MQRPVRLFLGSLGVLSSGCQEKVAGPSDAGVPPGSVEAGVVSPMPSGVSSGSPVLPDPLRVDIVIGGTPVTSRQLACGECVDMNAVVIGGRPPYSYAWNDAALSGSGPHHVCPRVPVSYGVQVLDTAPRGEFRRPSLKADASLHLDVGPCYTPDSGVVVHPPIRRDAGGVTPVDGGQSRGDASPSPVTDAGGQRRICPCSNAVTWSDGYFADPSFENLAASTRVGCSGTPASQLISSAGAGSAPDGFYYLGLSLPTSESETLRQPLRAGQRYWLSWAMASSSRITALTGIPLGAVDIYGATLPCAPVELLAEELFRPTESGGWIHVCAEFVPSQNYPYVVISARVANGNGTGFVSFDGIRVAPYTPSPTDYLWASCSSLPLGQPFQ